MNTYADGQMFTMKNISQTFLSLKNFFPDNGKKLAISLLKVLQHRLSEDESAYVSRIEFLRKELLASEETLEWRDFGARAPSAHLTSEEMYEGELKRKSTAEACRQSSKRSEWCAVLFHLIRLFRPEHCLELGTCLGISGAYLGAALKLNGQGLLTTLEGGEALARRALEHFRILDLSNTISCLCGRFQDLLPELPGSCKPIDFAFIDGHHDEGATKQYFKCILAKAAPLSIFVFDDISWSEGMKRAWKEIRQFPQVCVSVDVERMGICLLNSTEEIRERLHLDFPFGTLLERRVQQERRKRQKGKS
ncbi:MAG: class I SAM-dependent methyltransferase [Candidatus Ozemobacteraceae bacterium]